MKPILQLYLCKMRELNNMFEFDSSYSRLDTSLFKKVELASYPNPELLIFNDDLAKTLELPPVTIDEKVASNHFSGNALFKDSIPIAQAYAGHQFGSFTLLGDGRAALLGEHVFGTRKSKRVDVQLKGSGKTHYSRRGDGKATLYSMLREYLISESIHHLGIPTSRSLAVTATGEEIIREIPQKGAVLTRIMSSHIRFGTFEFISHFQNEQLQSFTDYVICRHYPELINKKEKYLLFLEKVMDKQISLIIQWLRVGFIHGVMNTDNMSVCGESFDFGPCAFMNSYDPETVFSSIDQEGRYSFGKQASIAHWNLGVFASTLLPLLDSDTNKSIEKATTLLEKFKTRFNLAYGDMLSSKFGFNKSSDSIRTFISRVFQWMYNHSADYTNTFLAFESEEIRENIKIYQSESFQALYIEWTQLIKQNDLTLIEVKQRMRETNPWIIPRNHLVETALTNFALLNKRDYFELLLHKLQNPMSNRVYDSKFQNSQLESEEGYYTFCGT
jgi:serine/tyrosine/threonine adenylyltransferase